MSTLKFACLQIFGHEGHFEIVGGGGRRYDSLAEAYGQCEEMSRDLALPGIFPATICEDGSVTIGISGFIPKMQVVPASVEHDAGRIAVQYVYRGKFTDCWLVREGKSQSLYGSDWNLLGIGIPEVVFEEA